MFEISSSPPATGLQSEGNVMRTIVIAASVLAILATPGFARTRHHLAPPAASEFNALAASNSAPFAASTRVDTTSPNLNKASYCVWGALGNC